MTRWFAILFYATRLCYLRTVHRQIVGIDPAHPEAARTWFEIQDARTRFDAAWSEP